MPRLEVELTSARDDGTWTWRAAGAREPRGSLAGDLLYPGAQVGDVVRAETEMTVDGTTVVAVLPPKNKRPEPERLELIGSGRDQPPVTTNLVKKRRDRDERGEKRRGRRETGRDKGRGRPRDDAKAKRPSRRPPAEPRPKPKRLRAQRAHREQVLGDLPDEQRVVAEQVLRGGVPAVRKAIDEQNAQLAKEGKPPIKPDSIVALAEDLLPGLREAEWLDRVDAALAGVDELDLRDLRSVVTAADGAARSSEARARADELRAGLTRRVEVEHGKWLTELTETLRDERTVRALRLSSRPPKAGAPLPPELSSQLAAAAAGALTADTGSERYALVLDALAFSPVHELVAPQGVPDKPSDELLAAVTKLAARIPRVAAAFPTPGPQPVTPPATGNKPLPPPPPPPPLPADASVGSGGSAEATTPADGSAQ